MNLLSWAPAAWKAAAWRVGSWLATGNLSPRQVYLVAADLRVQYVDEAARLAAVFVEDRTNAVGASVSRILGIAEELRVFIAYHDSPYEAVGSARLFSVASDWRAQLILGEARTDAVGQDTRATTTAWEPRTLLVS